MKQILFSSVLILFALLLFAQSWNPYLSQGIITPAPLQKAGSGGKGLISFYLGNTGSNTLNYDDKDLKTNLILVITLSNGIPDVSPLNAENAVQAVSGEWADRFLWEYDTLLNKFTGFQRKAIDGMSRGEILIRYKVTSDSPPDQPRNGFRIILDPPDYATTINFDKDDEVSCYTYTAAGKLNSNNKDF